MGQEGNWAKFLLVTETKRCMRAAGSGVYYYFNSTTEESSWEPPSDLNPVWLPSVPSLAEPPLVPPLLGLRVQIHGLVGKPQLNGTYGVAERYDQSIGRYMVHREDSSEKIALKPGNLKAVAKDVSSHVLMSTSL